MVPAQALSIVVCAFGQVQTVVVSGIGRSRKKFSLWEGLFFQPRLNLSQVLVLSACSPEIFKKFAAGREDKNPRSPLQVLDFVPIEPREMRAGSGE